jgi:hypothetical protein
MNGHIQPAQGGLQEFLTNKPIYIEPRSEFTKHSIKKFHFQINYHNPPWAD